MLYCKTFSFFVCIVFILLKQKQKTIIEITVGPSYIKTQFYKLLLQQDDPNGCIP